MSLKFILPYIFISLLFAISCHRSNEKAASDIAGGVCRLLQGSVSTENVDKAIEYYNNEIRKEPSLAQEPGFAAEMKERLESCFHSIFFTKNIICENHSNLIAGSAGKYFIMADTIFPIELNDNDNDVLKLKLTLNLNKENKTDARKDTIRLDGFLELLDPSRQVTRSYTVYNTQELLKLYNGKLLEATIYISLEPVWDGFSENPFELLRQSISKMEKAASFRLTLNLANNNDTADSILIKKTDAFVNDDAVSFDKNHSGKGNQ